MSFNLIETTAKPVVTGLRLEVDGKLMAHGFRQPNTTYGVRLEGGWGGLIMFHDEGFAREFLGWLGEKLAPPLVEIADPDEAERAPIGSVWQSEYPANIGEGVGIRNLYRRGAERWEWNSHDGDEQSWNPCNGTPCTGAYPLKPVGA